MNTTQSTSYTQLIEDLNDKKKIEDKVRLCLDFMQMALSTGKVPAFRDFWQAKKLCLELFKEKINTHLRSVFWLEYQEISEEMRKIKEVLDEEASFTFEQIELAVNALEADISSATTMSGSIEPIPNCLKGGRDFYLECQGELDDLNAFVKRLNALRNELIRVNLRMKQKNGLLEKLSKMGDAVFPKRKKRIQELSEQFQNDIEAYVSGPVSSPYFRHKEEVKALQVFAKQLTITTACFKTTREQLSNHWDQIKQLEKKQNEEKAKDREEFQKQVEHLLPQIEQLNDENLTFAQVEEKTKEIRAAIEKAGLGRNEIKQLRNRLSDARKPHEEKEQIRHEQILQEKKLEEKRNREKEELLHTQLTDLIDQAEAIPLDTLMEKWETLYKEKKSLGTDGFQEELLEHYLNILGDHVQEKKWQSLCAEANLGIDSALHNMLDERHKSRIKLKETLEQHRKVVGGSSLNMEESLHYQELIAEEKLRLDSLETMIEEIEEKLFDVEE